MCNGRFFKSSTRYVQHALMFPRVIETPAAVFRSTSTSDEDSSRSRPGLPNELQVCLYAYTLNYFSFSHTFHRYIFLC
ncbi:hypothetical protein Hanom_Chr10g00932131 [Helianthus anomalus]